MPNTASTDIEVAQRAMVLVGMNPLSTFTEATDEALVMNTTYEDIDKTALHSITGTLLQDKNNYQDYPMFPLIGGQLLMPYQLSQLLCKCRP